MIFPVRADFTRRLTGKTDTPQTINSLRNKDLHSSHGSSIKWD